METNCLLELSMEEGSEILGEVHLKASSSSADSTETDVRSILLDNSAESHGHAPYSTPGIDFEFVNTELGTGSSYTIDHSSVFDITEPIMDEKSDLFQDAGVFDDCIVKNTDPEKLQGLSLDIQTRKKLIMDLGLKLQIIPLNNLKLVSTIQTSEGIHFVALPDDSSIRLNPNIDQPLIRDILPHINPGMVLSTANHSLSSTNLTEESLKKVDTLKVVELETLSQPKSLRKSENVTLSTHETHSRTISSSSVFQLVGAQTELVNNGMKPTPRPLLKESKILIDLRKLQPQKRARRMVSLLNSPRTNKLFAKKQTELLTKTNIIPFTKATKRQANHRAINQIQKSKTLTKPSPYKHSKIIKSKSIKDKSIYRPTLECFSSKVNSVSKEKVESKAKRSKKRIKCMRSYLCEHCKANFIRLGNYRNHLQLHKTYEKLEQDLIENVSNKQPMDNKKKEENVDNSEWDERSMGNETIYRSIKETSPDEAKDFAAFEEPDALQEVKETAYEKAIKTNAEKKDLKCHICQLMFSSEGNLTRHKLIHMKTSGRYKCMKCEKSFHQQCDLTRHESTHSGKLPYSCTQCGKGFLRKSDLSGHEKFHGKEKTHKCSLCSKSYFQSGDLQRHIRQTHEDTCQFPCLYCSKKYTAQRSLFIHIRSKHMNQTLT